jgi:DNA repair photolyase
VPLITRFDPWQSSQCTCPPKLTFNPYTGCSHNCVYCYASSYIPRFADCRPKKDLLKRLEHEAEKLSGQTVSMSNSSDPYPPMEKELGLTRESLKILSRSRCRIQIVTKSPLAARDADLLSVASVMVRIDPVIPFVNDDAAELIKELAGMGVKHITASTYKVKRDNWRRFSAALPAQAKKLEPMYFSQGEATNGCVLLPRESRLKLLANMRAQAVKAGAKFAVCREGLSQLNTAACDGSWLLPALER